MNKPNFPQRKHPRLKGFDYSQNGAYFVTVCCKARKHLLGAITAGRGALTPPCIHLSEIGKTVEQYILSINTAYEGVHVDKYAVMPNHVHLLIRIDNSGGMRSSRPTLQTIIRSFKTMVTRKTRIPIWQNSFYEHIIRSEEDYFAIWKYIDQNPIK